MKKLISVVAGMGDWLVSLSDRARKQLVLGVLLILGIGGIHKLIVSIDNLSKPMPAASPEQLIKPMERLFEQTKTTVKEYQDSRGQNMSRLDSLATVYSNKK